MISLSTARTAVLHSEWTMTGFTGLTSMSCSHSITTSKVLGFSRTQVIPCNPPHSSHGVTFNVQYTTTTLLEHGRHLSVLEDWPAFRLNKTGVAFAHVHSSYLVFIHFKSLFHVNPTVSPFVHYLCMLSSKLRQCVPMFGSQSDSLISPRGRRATTTDVASRRWPI